MSTLIYEQLRHRANNLEKASARNRAPEKKKNRKRRDSGPFKIAPSKSLSTEKAPANNEHVGASARFTVSSTSGRQRALGYPRPLARATAISLIIDRESALCFHARYTLRIGAR